MAECTAFSQLSSIPCVSPLKLSSLPPLSSISQDLKGSVLSVQADLASTVFGKNRSRDTPCFSLWPPSNVFSSWKLWNQPLSSSLPPWPTNFFLSFFLFFFFFLSLKFLITYHPQALGFLNLFQWGGGYHQTPGQCASACLLHLPFSGLLFWPPQCGSGLLGPLFFPTKPHRSSKRESGLSSSANQWCSCSLPFLNVLKPSQVIEWRETQPTVEVPMLTENNLKHTLVDLTSQVLPLQTPTSVTAGRATH